MAGQRKGRLIFYPYKMGSKSCGDLVEALRNSQDARKTFRAFPDRRFLSRSNDIIINWGNSRLPNWGFNQMINPPQSVARAANKLVALRTLDSAGVNTPTYTTDREQAAEYARCVVRHKLNGHSGDGIEIIEHGNPIPAAPLYVEFLPKSVEYRVHIFRGKVIDYTKKVKRVNGEVKSRVDGDFVRSHELGWELIREVTPRESVIKLANDAVAALGLYFGAVDIIRSNRVNYVLEVNTACGLSEIGIEAYKCAIMELL